MKKIFVLLACIVMTTSVFAQEKGFSFGVKAGLNLSSFVGSYVSNATMKPNFYAGVVTELRISKLFAVSPELMYSGQGASLDVLGTNINLNTSNLNLPILAKFYVTKGLSLNVGPQLGFTMCTNIDGVKANNDTYNKFQVGAATGITYNFKKLFIEARYNCGFTELMKNGDNYDSTIQVGLGYKF